LEGKLKNFTGVSDPFEEPLTSDIILDGDEINVTTNKNLEIMVDKIQ
jgi:adenylylsulfate kinase-like enzyme